MNFRCSLLGWLLFLTVASALAGWHCASAPIDDAPLRVHWLGLQQIRTATNATTLLNIWNLPQTTALVAHTMDKLSRWSVHDSTNATAEQLRPLLDDFVASEFYLELSASTNSQPSTLNHQILLALRLSPARDRFWRTNLAAVIADFTGVRPEPIAHGWRLQQTNTRQRMEYRRAGGWTFLALNLSEPILQTDFAARILKTQPLDNAWLKADLEPARLAKYFNFFAGGDGRGVVEFFSAINNQLSTINRLHLSVTGKNGNVHILATLDFSRPLDLTLPSWEIPTNLIHAPLTSFTAARGFAGWLSEQPVWQKLQLAPPPNQAFTWAEQGIPFQVYLSAPLPEASNQLAQLAMRLVQAANPCLATNDEGYFQWQTNLPGIVWRGVPIIYPFLGAVVVNHHDYVLGGLFPQSIGDSSPPPAETLRHVLDCTNLVYCQSEVTARQVEVDLLNFSSLRLLFHKAQLPPGTPAVQWLKKIETSLGISTTTMTLTGPQQLSFTRDSTLGLTAVELQLLADWLESPQFPVGLHTFLTPLDK